MLFYTEFQKKFLENWANYALAAEVSDVGENPEFWKAMGDELIFCKVCTSQDQVVAAVQVWRRTVLDFKLEWSHSELRFKTGGWLVGTPCRNWEIAFLREDRNDLDKTLEGSQVVFNFHLLEQYYDNNCTRRIDLDFIGPGMDSGFRILGLADERQFVMSAELAFLISSRTGAWGEKSYESKYPKLNFYYAGAHQLKGYSRAGIGYPVFWLDAFDMIEQCDSSIHAKMLDDLSGRRKVPPDDVTAALNPFLTKFEGPPDKPYICQLSAKGDITTVLHDIPDEHIDEINRLRNSYVDGLTTETGIKDSLDDIDAIGSKPDLAQFEAKFKLVKEVLGE